MFDGICIYAGFYAVRTPWRCTPRADAAFPKPEIYEALEKRGVKYAIRIPANENLERDIAELLKRPLGRPSHKPVVWYKGFLYQAASWKTARRVVAKVEFHFGELRCVRPRRVGSHPGCRQARCAPGLNEGLRVGLCSLGRAIGQNALFEALSASSVTNVAGIVDRGRNLGGREQRFRYLHGRNYMGKRFRNG